MKRAFLRIFIFAIITGALAACGNSAKKDDIGTSSSVPLDRVKEFAVHALDMIKNNRMDSLITYYPDMERTDSIITHVEDSEPIVTETHPGVYEIAVGRSLRLIANTDDKGNITIRDSYGLFAFEPHKMDMAQKTGLWERNLSDVEFATRLSDQDFFNFLADRATIRVADILSVGEPSFSGSSDSQTGVQTITNLTDREISGDDYVIAMYVMSGSNGENVDNTLEPGKTIPPKGNVKIEVVRNANYISKVTGVKFKLSQEELLEKFMPYTGKEYEEYLNSKARDSQ